MKVFHPAKIRLLYGKPHDLTGLDENQVLEWIGQTLHERLADLKRMRVAVTVWPLHGQDALAEITGPRAGACSEVCENIVPGAGLPAPRTPYQVD